MDVALDGLLGALDAADSFLAQPQRSLFRSEANGPSCLWVSDDEKDREEATAEAKAEVQAEVEAEAPDAEATSTKAAVEAPKRRVRHKSKGPRPTSVEDGACDPSYFRSQEDFEDFWISALEQALLEGRRSEIFDIMIYIETYTY